MLRKAREVKKVVLIASMVTGMLSNVAPVPAQAASSDLTLTSGNTSLNDYFNWAKTRALSLDATMNNIKAARQSVGCTTTDGCEDPRVKNLYIGFVYLSDLDWVKDATRSGWGEVRKDRSVANNELKLNGVTFPVVKKGLGTHANSDIVYNLNGQYTKFTANVGVDNEVGAGNGSVQFQVFLDNATTPAFDSGRMIGGDAAKPVDVNVTGVNVLKLRVTDAGDGISNDHADWVNAGVYKANYTPPLIPAYWGSYADDITHFREAFCVRDIAHQSAAGHLLNMDNQNYSMFNAFAKSAKSNTSNPYWPYWSFDFFGNGYYMDKDWRELPFPFEIVQKGYEQYLWTGQKKWIGLKDDGTVDPNSDLYTYYTNVFTNFMNNQDQNHNGVADETKQLATYHEFDPSGPDKLFESGDGIGSQYQALLAYSKILEARGDATGATTYLTKANNLRSYFESYWYSGDRYVRGITINGTRKTDFGHENSFFMPLKLITDQGARTDSYLNFIDQSITAKQLNVEAKTYIPEMFYLHGKNDLAWKWMKNLMTNQHPYPEVSFTFVSNTITGMMGVQPDAPNQKVATVPRLTSEVPWVQADHVRIGGNDLKVRHDGNYKTTLTNNSGAAINWEAQFYGDSSQLKVTNGATTNTQTASHKDLNGKNVSYVTVSVPAGRSVTVEAPYYLSDMNWVGTPTIGYGKINLDRSVDNHILKLKNKAYTKGIGTHANSEIRYNLNGEYTTFTATVGVDDEVATGSGTVKFQVYLDNNTTPAFENTAAMKSGDAPVNVNVNVTGKNTLRLVVTDNGDGIAYDHADWAEAKLIK
ncbi:NPCBM/NEW2 domain-containing protein [Paenibacillus tyrfis]|uniref:NPCBM/NEW2 domain-containing protein n=1 Tax=Paenibacillus tyrfis TaxID=1501230 RepID=UPI00209E20E1|nr:NPCBM/NEW2 domain-containing protein [Paenibacillus tyrfis]MCP1306914.1 NPCBM/NEW2 domain-containing protein [Paenibacillus tyrfis]